jgi:hypothetical protein
MGLKAQQDFASYIDWVWHKNDLTYKIFQFLKGKLQGKPNENVTRSTVKHPVP